MNTKPKRVLFVCGVPLDIGGVEKSTMRIYRGIDKEKLLIDIAVRKPQKGYYHDEIEGYGGRIFNIFENTRHRGNKKWNIFMDLYSIYSYYIIMKTYGPFNAIHIVYPHLDGFAIIAAKLAKVPIRIVHSRNTGFDYTSRPNIIRLATQKLRLSLCKKYATHIWGCSKAACEYYFGDDIMEDERAEIPKNPVNISDYINKQCSRAEACRILNIPHEKTCFVNVGRYTPQKNQLFLLEFFAEMIKVRKDLHLMLTGPGPLEDDIKRHIKELGIEEYVTMLDSKTKIPLVLTASHFFLLPSIYEGFGNVLIEAQAAGIPCFVSDVCQPEPDIGLVDYIPLEKGAKYWAEFILRRISEPDERKVDYTRLMEYDVANVVPRMQRVYLEGIRYNAHIEE